ncbi:TadA family conjugal transfer-associated ATPase [Corynebacterium propinquum]|uniref:TadA family conjugal transfer-associated ATPase n=1 Tax=Corynebacterium propinquum TaxID=43769 RepID=UPI0026701DBD|nr:TadA family conjugal transfer-associated ATPase [Corynebacterium propinquum]WKS33373.1 TadA family conjugal transfer-associated ATPase [Corynebacterium propinquum]WKS39850.1 TadA family conjugal transfer-associated ATPase [Corynebacterium propinquum]
MSVAEHIVETIQRRVAAQPSLVDDPPRLARLIREESGVISDFDVLEILRKLKNNTVGIGVLEPLLSLSGITDIVVNGPDSVFFDRGEGLEAAGIQFRDDEEVRRLAVRLASLCGRRLDDAQPCVDGRIRREEDIALRFHAVLSLPAQQGTCISLRVLRSHSASLDSLHQRGSLDDYSRRFLHDLIAQRRSFLIVGGTGSGKTTLLSALLSEIDPGQRLVCIEDTPELTPNHPHVVNLTARGANSEGGGAISISDLLKQALRMRPDRIIVGEIRGAEVVDLLAALNTGHDGGGGTLHANRLTEVPARLEALGALGGLERTALHAQLTAAVEVVLVMQRGADGTRRLAQIGQLQANPLRITTVWEFGQADTSAEVSA